MIENKVLIQFSISYNKEKDFCLPFWSCVLDTEVAQIDYKFLTSNAKHKNLAIEGFYVCVKFSDFKAYQVEAFCHKRNAVFLPVNKNSTKCSPYISSCAMLENYYDTEFQVNYLQFVAKVEELQGKYFSDYQRLQIQKSAISAIKKIIGIDILNQESIPGSIAVYKRLPKFKVDANYNAEKGERYVKVLFTPEDNCEYLLEIEISDGNKILYKQIHNLITDEKITLPGITELENFGYVHLSVFKCDSNKKTGIIYEESGHLIRYFSFGINTYGGDYKIIQNRFTGKSIEKLSLANFSKNYSNREEFDPFRIEQEYKHLINGKDKHYLEDVFFSDDTEGRKNFLNWARNVLQRAKEVTIIDPFFDIKGFNDFNSCVATYFSLTVLTTDPKKCSRDEQLEKNRNSENLVNLIKQSFQNAKVYYVDKAKLHDRYLIIYDGDDTSYYSLSNSWNGTVNNYSLFVQELELSVALQVKDCYSKYLDEKYLQTLEEVNENENTKEDGKGHIFDDDVREKYSYAKNINKSIKNENFEKLFTDLFTAAYCGCKEIDKFEILPLCISKLSFVENSTEFVHRLVSKTLKEQKNTFEIEQKFLFNEKSLDFYKDINDCLRLVSSRYFCSGLPYCDLRIEYANYKILEACFAILPNLVIKELCDQEKTICIFNEGTKSEIKYNVSEQIVSYMLSENFRYFPEQKSNDLINFANKSENNYCKIYIVQWILDSNNKEQNFKNKLNSLLKLKIDSNDLAVFLGEFCSELLRIKNEPTKQKKDLIVNFICKAYVQNKDCLIQFALHAYLFSYEIYFDDFRDFLYKNKTVENDLKRIFLFYSLNSVPSRKLFLLLKGNVDKNLFDYLPEVKEKPSITDVGKFINYIPFVGHVLCEIIEKNSKLLKGIMYKFYIYPNFIFEINNPPADDFDCYVLLILLTALYEMKQQNINVVDEIDSIKWYMPFLLNMHDEDFYGLTFKILDIYTTFLKDDEKNILIGSLTSEKQKLFVISTLQEEIVNNLPRLQSLVSSYTFKKYDKTNEIIYLLALFINLVFYSDFDKNGGKFILSLLKNLKERFSELIKSQKIQNCLEKGIAFYSGKNIEKQKIFVEELRTLYCPYTSDKFAGECNE